MDNLVGTNSPRSAPPSKPPAHNSGFCRPTVRTSTRSKWRLAKLKAFFRAARPRSFDDVCDLVKTALGLFLPDECANYFRHAGYRFAEEM
jgi:hypothetical protein